MEDVTVPVAAAWPLICATRELSARRGVEIANFGHLVDGNIHCTPIKPEAPSLDAWHDELQELLPELYQMVRDLGGTISGEHGIGRKRVKYLDIGLSTAERGTMLAVKRALDPKGVLNPGVIFSE